MFQSDHFLAINEGVVETATEVDSAGSYQLTRKIETEFSVKLEKPGDLSVLYSLYELHLVYVTTE